MHTAVTFIGDYWNFLDLIELPDNLEQPMVAEKKVVPSKEQMKSGSVEDLEQRLMKHQWLGGQLPCSADREIFNTLKSDQIDVEKFPNTFAWYSLVQRFTDAVRRSWTGDAIELDPQSGLQTQVAENVEKVLDFDETL